MKILSYLPKPFPSIAIFSVILSIPALLQGQEIKASLLPSGERLFKTLYLDPNESQAFGAINAYWERDTFRNQTYMPLGFGFYKGLVRWNKKRPVELGFDASAQAQFEWNPTNTISTRNILNSEFKISLLLSTKFSEVQSLRLRFYHVSSHLGDDYLIQNQFNSYFPNPNNYEQLDITWYFDHPLLGYYVGMGAVVRPETIRKRLSFQGGSYFDKPISAGKLPLGFIAGVDMKMLQEDNFNPRLKTAIGLRMGQSNDTLIRLVIEFYRGNLPYSPYEYKRVQWLGLGIYFSP